MPECVSGWHWEHWMATMVSHTSCLLWMFVLLRHYTILYTISKRPNFHDKISENFTAKKWMTSRVYRLVYLSGTVMCFGQTGAGKTYTMTGSTESYKQRGIIPRAIQEVTHLVKIK